MHTAGKEWADRVAARNAAEAAKARISEAPMAKGFLPLTYGEVRQLPLSAAGKEAAR